MIGAKVSDTSQGPGWWLASDGRWYPPAAQPGYAVQTHPAYSDAYNRPQGYYPREPAPGDADGFALASLVLSLLWIFGLGSLVAIVFALVALRRIKASHGVEGGKGLASAGLIIGFCGLIGTAGFFLVLRDVSLTGIEPQGHQGPTVRSPSLTQPTSTSPSASTTQPLTTLPPPASTQSTINPLGVTLNVPDPSGAGFTKVLVQDVAYPVSVGLSEFAIASVGVCAGPGGSQAGPTSHAFVLGVTRGEGGVHTSADAIPGLGPDSCTDAELYFEIPPGSSPAYVAYGPYHWLVPAR